MSNVLQAIHVDWCSTRDAVHSVHWCVTVAMKLPILVVLLSSVIAALMWQVLENKIE